MAAPINLRDYSRTAAQRGWGAGWPSCGGAKAAGTAVVEADTSKVRVSVHKRVARLVDLLMDTTERRGYLLKAGQCGGYNCRAISGTSSPSNHSWGLAVDLNWQTNPYTRPRRTDMPAWLPLLWNRYGFAWGGNYGSNGTTGRADSMHFEFMGSPEQADAMTALALRELSGGTAPSTPPAGTPVTREENDVLVQAPIYWDANRNFRTTCKAEAGAGSVFSGGWAFVSATWGALTDVRVFAHDGKGRTWGPYAPAGGTVQNNTEFVQALPAGTRYFTAEGRAANQSSIATVSAICKPA